MVVVCCCGLFVIFWYGLSILEICDYFAIGSARYTSIDVTAITQSTPNQNDTREVGKWMFMTKTMKRHFDIDSTCIWLFSGMGLRSHMTHTHTHTKLCFCWWHEQLLHAHVRLTHHTKMHVTVGDGTGFLVFPARQIKYKRVIGLSTIPPNDSSWHSSRTWR
jgi:hypothetical protein